MACCSGSYAAQENSRCTKKLMHSSTAPTDRWLNRKCFMSTCHSVRNTGWPSYNGNSFSKMMKTVLEASRSRMNQSRPR